MQQQQVQQGRYTTASTLKCKFFGTIYFLHCLFAYRLLLAVPKSCINFAVLFSCVLSIFSQHTTLYQGPKSCPKALCPFPFWQFGLLLSLLWSIVPYPMHFSLCFGTLSRLQVWFYCGYTLLEVTSPTFLFCPLPLVSLSSTKAPNISLPCFIPALSKVLPALSMGFCVWSLPYHVATSYYYHTFDT